jgi:sulfofructose kinase
MKLDCVGLGFNCVDLLIRIPQMPSFRKHRHTHVLNFDMQGGGPVSTGLVAMARLGAKVGYVGKVGDDQWGDFIRREYIKYGVETSRLTVEKGKTSNCSFVLVEADTGERVFIVSPSNLSPLGLTQDDREYITDSRLLFLDSGGHAMIEAAQIAKDHGIPVLLDGLANGKLRGLVDIAICGEEMAYRTAKTTDAHEALEKLYPNGYKILGITLGPKGSIFKAGKKTHIQKAFPVEVVDTTGAGDVFHGAFAYGTLQGWSIEKTAEFASAVSALKCTRLGGRSGIPSLQDTTAFLKNRNSAYF